MVWLLVAAAVLLLVLLVAATGRRARQGAAVRRLRQHFPRIARLRLVAACPGVESVLREEELARLFDWILLQLYERTGTSEFGELMRWGMRQGQAQITELTAAITLEAVDRLPAPAVAVIDQCQGRAVAAVLLDQALTEAGQRVAPGLERGYA